ncbi:amidohydrolase family protein [Clavibacter lycopersici]|uniref:Amidohydrolase family protein n=1 Tax=Clavibacter lycopersici TaxID=2301718 RepID=A0A399T5C9_9MICO|nr:amidohydrolase family protein [Clavibacter lycopersici]RIJ51028.1 amidohydrolase family protein [Clavibacter lycopersici]RIJ61374.1 amidohydrolase family protein [Clavibacter lycopersici]
MSRPPAPALTGTRLTGARLIDGTGRPPVDDAVVVVDDAGVIAYAGPAATAPPADGARTVDLGGRTLLPGFIDTHVHLSMDSADGPYHRVANDPAVLAFETADRIRRTLDAGVTTARDLGGLSAGYRDAVERGLIPGPRLHVAVKVISHTGGHGDFHLPGGEIHTHTEAMSEIADGVDEVRRATRRIVRAGADVVKICTTGGMGSPHDAPEDEGLRIDEVRAIADELERHGGKPLAAHAQGTAGIHAAVLGGVTSVEHGYGIDDEAIDMMGERGTFLVPTLSTVFMAIDRERMAPYHYEKKTRWTGITKVNVAHAIERGVRIALGTDSGVGPHGQNLRELGWMVGLGMDPMDAIVAGTRTAAQLLGIADRVGTLEAGRLADLVVTDVDPLTRIADLGDPRTVLVVAQAGRVVKDTIGLLDRDAAGATADRETRIPA